MPIFNTSVNFESIHKDKDKDGSGDTINKLTLTNDTEFYFYIRGHIRDSFNTDRLKNFVKLLKSNFKNIKFILQTWKHKECKKSESYRYINEDNTIISKQIIENYFKDEDITKQCLIIDEKSIELVGKTHGKICQRSIYRGGHRRGPTGKSNLHSFCSFCCSRASPHHCETGYAQNGNLHQSH